MFKTVKSKINNYFRVKRLKIFVDAYPNLSDLIVLDVDGADLLSYRELEKLFPDQKIYSEKFLGLSKSFIVID